MRTTVPALGLGFLLFLGIVLPPTLAFSHCDTLDGPVVLEAKKALETGDVTPVLKWVKGEQEKEIRSAFRRATAVRKGSPAARELADLYFFETVVRLHRASEGAPYTGLSPGPAEPIIVETDKSLKEGSVDLLVKQVTEAVAKGIRQRFQKTLERNKHAGESVAAGREFVKAYVDFTHYVERLHLDAAGGETHSGEPAAHKH